MMSKDDHDKIPDYHQAIKNVVSHLKTKRKELLSEISHDQVEKARVTSELSKLQDKLRIIDSNLQKKSQFRKEYDKAILQSEENFLQLIEKSENFLALTRREAIALSHAICDRPKVCETQGESSSDCCPGEPERAQPSRDCYEPPVAVLSFNPPQGNCSGCSNANPCTTIMVPYRANGL